MKEFVLRSIFFIDYSPVAIFLHFRICLSLYVDDLPNWLILPLSIIYSLVFLSKPSISLTQLTNYIFLMVNL